MVTEKEIEAALNAYYADDLDNTTKELITNVLQAAEQERQEWRPISEYNKDIHPNCVMVFDRLPVPARYDSEGDRWMVGGKFLDHPDYFVALRVNPTHFQYLPNPPIEKNNDEV